jgi:branched-chain amino acid aminotransferase
MTPPPAAIADATAVWFDGTLLGDPTLHLHALTHALHYGSAVFEGIRLYPTPRGPAIFRLRDHLERLYDGAKTYGLQIPFGIDRFTAAVIETVRAASLEAAYIRPLVFFGGTTVKLEPARLCETHVLIVALPFTGLLRGDEVPQCTATFSPVMKTPSGAVPSTVKGSGHYMNSIRAHGEAVARGFDEAIMFNHRGEIAEGPGENLFVVRDGTLITNDERADVLPGITRATVLELARDMGIPATIRPLTRADVEACAEAFFTGTAAEVVPILRVDDRVMPDARPVTDRLRTAYAEVVRGRRAAPADWLTFLTKP